MISPNVVSIIGYLAAFCGTVSFIPQAIEILIKRSAHDVSGGMYSLFTVGVLLWLAYGICIGAWPIIIANAVTALLAITIIALKLRFG